MDNDSAGDEGQKEMSISLAASSMINASDMISKEAYQANLRRIQEVKEMVQRLEMNNESAHKNFLVGQLEKRAKDGRQAEVMLAQLRSGHPSYVDIVQSTNSLPADKSEVLPTTASLVEVPDSHTIYSSPAPTTTSIPQTIQQGRPAEYQWSLPAQVYQVQSYNPNSYYTPPSTIHQPPQHSIAPSLQGPVDGRMGWYTTQNVPTQARVHNPAAPQSVRVQQPSQSPGSYTPPNFTLPTTETLPASRYYTSSHGWIRAAPAQSGSIGSSIMMYRDPGIPTQPSGFRPPVSTHDQSRNLSSLAPTSQVQVPLHDMPVPLAKVTSNQPSGVRSQAKPTESHPRPFSTAISEPGTISEFQRPHRLAQQPQQHQKQPQPSMQPQQLPRPASQSQQHSQPSQSQPQRPLQLPPRAEQRAQQSPELQLSQMRSRASLQQSTDHVTSASTSQSQPPQTRDILQTAPIDSQIQPPQPQRSTQSHVDHATFIKNFQISVQRGIPYLKAFLLQAKASGISNEWFRAAINALPRGVWESVVSQLNQSEPTLHTLNVPSPANASRHVPTILASDVSVVNARPSPTIAPPVQSTPTQHVAKSTIPIEGGTNPSTLGQNYAAQLQYYAQQAIKSTLSAQVTTMSPTPPGNISMQEMITAPARDVPQAQVNTRTPRDADKSTLARDILRSLGKIVPKLSQETGSEPTGQANILGQLPEVNSTQSVFYMASSKPLVVPPVASIDRANSPLVSSANANVQAEPQYVVSPNLSTAKSISTKECGQAAVIKEPIRIDLTLEDSESVDGKGQEPEVTFPMQTSASAVPPSQSVSPTNTTNHTPLLKNLSLEELPVDVAANGDNAAVRMYSPPLLSSTGKNMGSDTLPLLGSAVLVSPSFKALRHKTSDHSLDAQLPLFLPSPPVSPAHTEPSEMDLETANEQSKSGPSLKRRSVDVDEMEIDIAPARVQKRPRRQVYVLIPPAPFNVKNATKKMRERVMEEDIDSGLEGVGEEIQYSHLEQLLIEESKSRLLERRCRWLNCAAVLNCAANLLGHLKDHAREEGSQAPFHCRWASCQRQFDRQHQRDVHLERHTIRPLPCPLAGCDEQFNKPVEVMQHEVQHQKAEHGEPLTRKPMYQPVVPAIPARLGPPPHQLPSHRVIPRRIVKCRISADRHATVGPWILWNIFSPVDLNTRKQNASMRGRPMRQAASYDVDSSDPRQDDYDFLLALSSNTARGPLLDDLDSAVVTMSVARGLTLWGSEHAVKNMAGTPIPEEYEMVSAAVPISTAEEVEAEGKPNRSEVATSTRENGRPEEQQSREEAAVD